MLELNGSTLCKRQQQLNVKVKEAIDSNINFNGIKDLPEQSDVDKFYKIDIAIHLKNVEYIIEILKSGDPVHISRALKAKWLYSDEYSNIINPDYLHHEIFPFMSDYMKKKLLNALYINLKNEERALQFHKYCEKVSLKNIAWKFLCSSSDGYKKDYIQSENNIEYDKLKDLIGNSMELFKVYMFHRKNFRGLFALCHFFDRDPETYLNYIENLDHNGYDLLCQNVSKKIITKHKERVCNKPNKYVHVLNKKVVLKYSTSDDAKIYLKALLPTDVSDYWQLFTSKYSHIIELIPSGERFQFLKKIFTESYEGKPFETSLKFYQHQYYRYMTVEEKETWALSHINKEPNILGDELAYLWYTFVNFEKSFADIKKLILVATTKQRRQKLLEILVHSAKTQEDLETLLKYYYNRHINEDRGITTSFLALILDHHKVYGLRDSCWEAFNQILHAIGVYSENYEYRMVDLKLSSLLYHIIHDKDIPKSLSTYITEGVFKNFLRLIIGELDEEKLEKVFQVIFKHQLDKILEHEQKEYNDDVKRELRCDIDKLLDTMKTFKKLEHDRPQIVLDFMSKDSAYFYKKPTPPVTDDDMVRYLKNDTTLVLKELPKIKSKDTYHIFRKFYRKLKIYFANDIANEYVSCFVDFLNDKDPAFYQYQHAIYGIYQLANNEMKIGLMNKYAPITPKINHSEIDRNHLEIQESICRYHFFTRPQVPLSNTLAYLKGDYLSKGLPCLDYFMAHMVPSVKLEFISRLIDSPVSSQKHGIRMAFKVLSAEDLKKLIAKVWKNKNVSLRMILINLIIEKVKKYSGEEQRRLFENLKICISELNADDDVKVYSELTNNAFPKHLQGECYIALYKRLSTLPPKTVTISRLSEVIRRIKDNIEVMNVDNLKLIVDDYIKTELLETKKTRTNQVISEIKCELTAKYIVSANDDVQLEKNKELLDVVLKKCFDNWEAVDKTETYFMQKRCFDFIDSLIGATHAIYERNHKLNIALFEHVLRSLQESLPLYVVYSTLWSLHLNIIEAKVIVEGKIVAENMKPYDKAELARNVCIHFGSQIDKLIQQYVENNCYHSRDILSMGNVHGISNAFSLYEVYKESDLYVFVCKGLSSVDLPEVDSMILSVLPSDCPENSVSGKDYESIFKLLHSKNHLKYEFYEKFVKVGFKKRRYF